MLDHSVKLLIVGECYSDRAELDRELADPRLDGRAVWVDSFVPDQDVAMYFRAADIVVLPYRHATQSAVAQTALGFRKPLVLTDTGGLAEVVDEGETGILVPPSDSDALAEGIRKGLALVGEPGLEDRIAVKAGEFGWEEYVRRLRERWP
jgi:glycosyltransferase involved in cell wall biosynthesis